MASVDCTVAALHSSFYFDLNKVCFASIRKSEAAFVNALLLAQVSEMSIPDKNWQPPFVKLETT